MIAVIDCGGANLRSVSYALEKLNIDYRICNKKKQIKDAEALVLPGVGAAKNVMNTLKNQDLTETIKNFKNPILGICVGMQILYEYSDEENEICLGMIPGRVKKFQSNNLIVPQMGWNKVEFNNSSFDDCDGYYYFANSYYADINLFTKGSSIYGHEFSSFIQKDNLYGVQFHPEKSSYQGEKFLKKFFELI